MFATLLAGFAEYETEVRGGRQAAGVAAAKAAGKTWGGRRYGARWKVTDELERQERRMAGDGETVATIARLFDLSRTTVYRILEPPTPPPGASA